MEERRVPEAMAERSFEARDGIQVLRCPWILVGFASKAHECAADDVAASDGIIDAAHAGEFAANDPAQAMCDWAGQSDIPRPSIASAGTDDE